MRNVRFFCLYLLILSYPLIGSIQSARAEDLVVGVKPGDWVKYRYVYNFTTTNPDELSSNRFEVFYIFLEVLSVTGYNVECEYSIFSKNGPGMVMKVHEDIRLYGYVVAANLIVGDSVLHPKMDMKINMTVKTDCLGVERELNWVVLFSFDSENEHFLSFYVGWDRASGILTEVYDYGEIYFADYVTIWRSQTRIIDTNIWAINAIPFDLDRDNFVGITDIIICAEAFGSDSTTHSIRWNPYCDIDKDSQIGIEDLLIIAQHFGESI